MKRALVIAGVLVLLVFVVRFANVVSATPDTRPPSQRYLDACKYQVLPGWDSSPQWDRERALNICFWDLHRKVDTIWGLGAFDGSGHWEGDTWIISAQEVEHLHKGFVEDCGYEAPGFDAIEWTPRMKAAYEKVIAACEDRWKNSPERRQAIARSDLRNQTH